MYTGRVPGEEDQSCPKLSTRIPSKLYEQGEQVQSHAAGSRAGINTKNIFLALA